MWTYETVVQANVATTSTIDLTATLLTQESLADTRGVTFMGARGHLTGVATTAPGAATRDIMFAGIVRADLNLPAANRDPSSIAARSLLDWAWLEAWPQPYSAAPVAYTQIVESDRTVLCRSKRLCRQSQDRIFFVSGNQAAGQSFHLDGLLSCLWKVR